MTEARYDSIADWYRSWRPELAPDERDALRRLLGEGEGRCLDVGCGAGAATAVIGELGWSVVGTDVSTGLLEIARNQGLDVVEALAESLPFEDDTFDAVVSVWTHTDVEDFAAAAAEIGRVLRPGAPFVYIGAHPCFVGPHALLGTAGDVPQLAAGYRRSGRYDASAFGVGDPDGVRIRVGAVHLTLHEFFAAFTDTGFQIERFEELGDRDYPYSIALRAHR